MPLKPEQNVDVFHAADEESVIGYTVAFLIDFSLVNFHIVVDRQIKGACR